MTRNGRKFRHVAEESASAAQGYRALFAALFCNAARIDGIMDRVEHLTDDYILQILYEWGGIAYHKDTKLWLPFEPVGIINAYGYADHYRLFSAFGSAFTPLTVRRDDIYIFDANAVGFAVERFVNTKCKLMARLDGAIWQNLDAVKEMGVVVTDSNELARKLIDADKKRRNGESVAIIPKKANDGSVSELARLGTGATFIIDRLQDARRKEWEDLLHIVGVGTPTEKGERMYTTELEMQSEETDAYIGLMIDTFNRQAEEQGAPFRMARKPRQKREENDGTDKNPTDGENGENGGK